MEKKYLVFAVWKSGNDCHFQVHSQNIRLAPSLHDPAKAKEQLIFHSQGFMENYTPPTQWYNTWTKEQEPTKPEHLAKLQCQFIALQTRATLPTWCQLTYVQFVQHLTGKQNHVTSY